MKIQLIVVLLAALSGCAAKGPLYATPLPPTEGYARVVIYRQPSLSGRAWAHHYYIDRQRVADLRVGGYTTLLVKPGARLFHYNVMSDDELLPFAWDLEAGRTFHLKEGQHVKRFVPLGPVFAYSHEYRFGPVPEEHAAKELIRYRYQAPAMEMFDGSDDAQTGGRPPSANRNEHGDTRMDEAVRTSSTSHAQTPCAPEVTAFHGCLLESKP